MTEIWNFSKYFNLTDICRNFSFFDRYMKISKFQYRRLLCVEDSKDPHTSSLWAIDFHHMNAKLLALFTSCKLSVMYFLFLYFGYDLYNMAFIWAIKIKSKVKNCLFLAKYDFIMSKNGVPSKGAKLCKEEDFWINGRFSGNGKGEIEAWHEHSWSESRDYISL